MKKPGKRTKRAFVHLRKPSEAEVFPLKPSGKPSPDTKQQKAILRQNRTARLVRQKFPPGTRVAAVDANGVVQGTVERHVPGTSAGGYLVVRWDNGIVGRPTAMSLMRVEREEQ